MLDLVRSSSHNINSSTSSKLEDYHLLRTQFKEAVIFIVDYLWSTPITWISKSKNGAINSVLFDIFQDKLDIPKYLTIAEIIPIDSPLTSRAFKAAAMRALAIVKSQITVRRNLLFIRACLIKDGKSTVGIDLKLAKTKLTKPKIYSANPIFCCENSDFLDEEQLLELAKKNNSKAQSHFDGFLRIKYFNKLKTNINLPIQFTKVSNKHRKHGYKIVNAFELAEDRIIIKWKREAPPQKEEGKVIGIDQGINNALTCSNGFQVTQDARGHSLDKIIKKMDECKDKTSRKFRKLQAHQINFIGWGVNQLNLDNVREVHLEQVKGLGNKSHHWYYPLIQKRIESKTSNELVALKMQSSYFRSQRCNRCGFVHRLNRKGEKFVCRACGLTEHSDLNAAKNHVSTLSKLTPMVLDKRKLSKITGFYWLENGIYSIEERQEQLGEEIKISIKRRMLKPNDTVPVGGKNLSRKINSKEKI